MSVVGEERRAAREGAAAYEGDWGRRPPSAADRLSSELYQTGEVDCSTRLQNFHSL